MIRRLATTSRSTVPTLRNVVDAFVRGRTEEDGRGLSSRRGEEEDEDENQDDDDDDDDDDGDGDGDDNNDDDVKKGSLVSLA